MEFAEEAHVTPMDWERARKSLTVARRVHRRAEHRRGPSGSGDFALSKRGQLGLLDAVPRRSDRALDLAPRLDERQDWNSLSYLVALRTMPAGALQLGMAASLVNVSGFSHTALRTASILGE
jgi:hypothetical protein